MSTATHLTTRVNRESAFVAPNSVRQFTTTAAMQRRNPILTLLGFLFFASAAHALHFYLDANEKRCFIEEVPSDTVVEGQSYLQQE